LSIGQHPTQKSNASPLEAGLKSSGSSQKTVRVLAFLEARWPTTGPAKNLLEFGRRAADNEGSELRANLAIAIFCRGKEPTSNDFVLACEKAGLQVYVLRERSRFDLTLVPAMRKLVALCQPEIIESHAVKSHFLIRLTGINRGRNWIAFHHGYTWTSLKIRIYNFLDRWSLPSASKVVTDCRPFASSLLAIGVRPERIMIQHSSVDAFSPASEEEVLELRRNLGIPMDARVILCVGRLSREKAQADLVEAAALIHGDAKQGKLRFVLVGEGPDRQKLEDMARYFRMEDWFVFTGHVSDLRPYYTMANLFVLPSHTEGSPNVLLEAMAAGLPIVATAVGGVPEIVTNEKEALLVEKRSPAALAQAISRLLDDTILQRKLAEAARLAISNYSSAAYCDSILSLYQRCLAGNDELANR